VSVDFVREVNHHGGFMQRAMKSLIFFLIVFSSVVQAQRKGAIETGGLFYFRSESGGKNVANNSMNVDWLIGFYMDRNLVIDVEPNIMLSFGGDSTNISSINTIGLSYRIIDMISSYDERRQNWRARDVGVTAGVFASIAAGFWLENQSKSGQESASASGGAYSIGIGTHAGFGKFTVLRTKFEFLYLLPNPPMYDKGRTLFQIGVGFSVFIKI
jgi:hypothetical protein